jgi:hypothetical protein
MRHQFPMRVRSIAVLGLAAVAMILPASAQQPSIAGAWNGSGTVNLSSGNKETVRCRATFNQLPSGATMRASCASPSARVNQTAELTRVSGNRYVGDFVNSEYGVSGSIRITVSGNSLSASLAGGGGSASMNLSR